MENTLKLKYKIGEIEFEAEGSSIEVEHQRDMFMKELLSSAVEAMVRTKNAVIGDKNYIDNHEVQMLSNDEDVYSLPLSKNDTQLSQMSINEFLKVKGFKSQIEIAIGLIYYNEKFKERIDFSTEELKTYFREAKIKIPSNPSDVVAKLIVKPFIMKSDEKHRYKLTITGENYVDNFIAKEEKMTKRKVRKIKSKIKSMYSSLNVDDMNLNKYPVIKEQSSFKERMMLTLYIISKEGLGDEFSTLDVECIMTDKLGLPATGNQVQGVFSRNKTWFKDVEDETNKKAIKHKLLTGAKDFAKTLIEQLD